MKKVKSIDFVLENCEVINVPLDNIWRFNIGKSYIKRELYKDKLRIYNKITDLFCIIENNDSVKNICEWSDFTDKPINRLLAYNDIAQMHINYDDKNNTKDVFYIEWWGNDQCNNEGQKTWQLNDKLMIRIANPETIKEIETASKPEITD